MVLALDLTYFQEKHTSFVIGHRLFGDLSQINYFMVSNKNNGFWVFL